MEYSFAGPDTVAWRVHYDLLKSLVADIKRHIPISGSRTIISILTLLYCMMCYAWEYMFLGVGWLSNGCLVPFTGHSRGVFTIWSREAGNSYTEFLIMHIHWIAIWAWKTKRHWSNYNVNQKTSTQGTVTETFWSFLNESITYKTENRPTQADIQRLFGNCSTTQMRTPWSQFVLL